MRARTDPADCLLAPFTLVCSQLDAILEVDREAIEFEKDKIGARFGGDKSKVQETADTLQSQVDRLKKIRKEKGCKTAGANLKQASDFEVYKRADEGVLNSARVIERAKAGKLVDGSGATCFCRVDTCRRAPQGGAHAQAQHAYQPRAEYWPRAVRARSAAASSRAPLVVV